MTGPTCRVPDSGFVPPVALELLFAPARFAGPPVAVPLAARPAVQRPVPALPQLTSRDLLFDRSILPGPELHVAQGNPSCSPLHEVGRCPLVARLARGQVFRRASSCAQIAVGLEDRLLAGDPR